MPRGSTTNQAFQHVMMQRRALVSDLRCKGYTLQKIHQVLATPDQDGNLRYFNPETKKAWSFGTIEADVHWAEEQWKNQILKDMSEIKARQLQELEMVRSNCWGKNSIPAMRAIIAALAHEAKITGIEAAQVHEHVVKPDEDYQLELLNQCIQEEKPKDKKKK
jgi:DNA-binding transcriptional MerR regulator